MIVNEGAARVKSEHSNCFSINLLVDQFFFLKKSKAYLRFFDNDKNRSLQPRIIEKNIALCWFLCARTFTFYSRWAMPVSRVWLQNQRSNEGKVQWGYPYVKHQPVTQGQTTRPGTTCPTLSISEGLWKMVVWLLINLWCDGSSKSWMDNSPSAFESEHRSDSG